MSGHHIIEAYSDVAAVESSSSPIRTASASSHSRSHPPSAYAYADSYDSDSYVLELDTDEELAALEAHETSSVGGEYDWVGGSISATPLTHHRFLVTPARFKQTARWTTGLCCGCACTLAWLCLLACFYIPIGEWWTVTATGGTNAVEATHLELHPFHLTTAIHGQSVYQATVTTSCQSQIRLLENESPTNVIIPYDCATFNIYRMCHLLALIFLAGGSIGSLLIGLIPPSKSLAPLTCVSVIPGTAMTIIGFMSFLFIRMKMKPELTDLDGNIIAMMPESDSVIAIYVLSIMAVVITIGVIKTLLDDDT